LAHLLRKSKNYGKEESGKRIFGMLTSGKRRCIFWQGVLRKMYGHEAAKEKKVEKG
jgi:hypothetical protein